jgi:hypothetical protein
MESSPERRLIFTSMGDSADMRFHRHEHVEVEPAPDPLAAAVWQDGLSHASASSGLVVHAPHASDLAPASSSTRRDAA